MSEQPVHYLTLEPLRIACPAGRKDLTGAPLNTVHKAMVTCPACLQVLGTVTQ